MDRFQGHFYNIKSKQLDDPIGFHFNLAGHGGLQDVTIHILQFIKAGTESEKAAGLRDSQEKKWIHRLHTVAPFGLNTMD